MSNSNEHIVIIGAVALGPKAACRYKRLNPKARVTMLDMSDIISYGGCGIPYFVSGDVSDIKELRTTSFHMLRDEEFFNEVKGVDVLVRTQALAIDRAAKTVRIKSLDSGEESDLQYDKLVISTGSRPRVLPIPGVDLDGVHRVGHLHDAERIRESVTKGEVERAVIVGAGFIGLEMAEALADMWGVEVDVVEIADQLLPNLVSPDLARMAAKHMGENGVNFHFGTTVQAIEGDGHVERVVTSGGTLDADMVILAAGVLPNDALAREAGLEVHERGGIIVDEQLCTSDPDIYAGGDCVVIRHLITGKPFHLPMGSMSNRQGRIIGNNLAGGRDRFQGAVGSFVVKLFDTSVAGTGLSLGLAQKAGFKARSVLVIQLDRAHFYPEKDLMTLEMVVDEETGRVLGAQGFGGVSDAMVGRINAVAGILPFNPTVADISNMEMAYSPPFASAMDILNCLGNVAANMLDGLNRGVSPAKFAEMWNSKDSDYYFLDCREIGDAKSYLEAHPDIWHNIPQGKLAARLDEVPKDKTVVLVCNTGARSYEAQVTLDDAGYERVVNLHGGMAGLKKWGLDI